MHPIRMNSASIVRLTLFVVSFTLAILIKKIYRPWIYQRGAWGLGVADLGSESVLCFWIDDAHHRAGRRDRSMETS